MSRKLLLSVLFLFAMLIVGPAAAQLLPAPAAPPPLPPAAPQMQVLRPALPPVAVLNEQHPADIPAWMTPERAKAAIEKLQADNHKLREQYTLTLTEYQKTLARLDEMVRAGRSEVTARCEGVLSVNNAGGSENCASSGYACNNVSGLCERSCHEESDKCADGYICGGGDHCVPRPGAG